ncbi:quinol:cytochrome C oxidoreductase [Fluviispira multicolorata]|uniref:Quinol:cytochrome C oxidoreductase n=1 Tax=Fluviispira multicolorata TaxID=2654512 RepID=A0A833N1P1_9BACT|nr:quinol:cytochrome C oxidoreductase [Fluviispira multicolorata]KAB8030995.1 quinol:cytochrome C oxidoreductase [Fluviispira multicolorata]
MSGSHTKVTLTQENARLPQEHFFSKLPLAGTAVGLASLLIAFMLGRSNSSYFFFSFHVWWLFFLSIAIGAVFFVLIQFATKSGWSVVVRRLAENISMTMPLFFVLVIVMAFGTGTLYHHWLSHEALADKVLQSKQWYLNIPFFYIRTIFYMIMFTWAAIYFSKRSAKQDETGNFEITYKLQNASYPFLIILGFCVTFAAFDWIMSLDPHWYSTIFGLYFFASCYMVFFAALIIATRIVHNVPALKDVITVEHYHDLGKLLFAHTCFWAYAAFCQYLLIWYGNIPEETAWYGIRENHGWFYVFVLLCVGHFIVPFLFLMARRAKRSRNLIFAIAIWMLFMHFLDLYWLVVPSGFEEGPQFGLIDIFCFLGIGGLFVALFAAVTRRKALVPIKDPRLPESMTYENV